MEGFKPEEIKVIEALTIEELERRRISAMVTEERARHEKQLCEWELHRRARNVVLARAREVMNPRKLSM